MDYIYWIITGLSICASILAWTAKLRWSKEFRLSKESEILAIKEQVNILKEKNESLKEFTSDRIMALYSSTKKGLELDIERRELAIEKIQEEKNSLTEKIKELEADIDRLKKGNETNIIPDDLDKIINTSLQINKSYNLLDEHFNKELKILTKTMNEFKNKDKDFFYNLIESTNNELDMNTFLQNNK